jgi:large conductance mechanosensitive channel
MFKEFKEFALKGNVIDLAIGVIVGGAFGKIVDAMVGDLIMPLVSMLIGHLDFSNYFIALAHVPDQVPLTLDALKKAGIPVFAYGCEFPHLGLCDLSHGQTNQPLETQRDGGTSSRRGGHP